MLSWQESITNLVRLLGPLDKAKSHQSNDHSTSGDRYSFSAIALCRGVSIWIGRHRRFI